MKKNKGKKKLGLTTVIFIALIAGAVTGTIINNFFMHIDVVNKVIVEGIFYVIGQGFISLMKMLVVPLVFCSIVCGAASIGDTKTLGKVGVRTIIFYICTTMLAVAVSLSVASLINPGLGLDMSAVENVKTTIDSSATNTDLSLVDTILNIIPTNPIASLANGEMLQIIVFALIVGIILAKLKDKAQLVSNFFQQGNDIMMEMTMMIMKIAPIGVFCLVGRTFSELGFSAMVPMFKYMITVVLALAIQCYGVYMIMLRVFAGLNPFKFAKKFFPVQAFAFSTATSNATIPLNIDTLEERLVFHVRFLVLPFLWEQPLIWMELPLCKV